MHKPHRLNAGTARVTYQLGSSGSQPEKLALESVAKYRRVKATRAAL